MTNAASVSPGPVLVSWLGVFEEVLEPEEAELELLELAPELALDGDGDGVRLGLGLVPDDGLGEVGAAGVFDLLLPVLLFDVF